MMHTKRRWCVGDIAEPELLADRLNAGRCWCLCTGFRHGGYLFLNDATCEDGGMEFGAIKDDGSFKQVESITFSWCDRDKALEYIKGVVAGEYDSQAWDSGVKPECIDTLASHERCNFCA